MAATRIVNSAGVELGVTGSPLITAPVEAAPAGANVLVGRATADAAVIITIPAGRTWKGSVQLSGALGTAAATAGASASPTVSTAGVGVVPAAGAIVGLDLRTGGGVATGTVGTNSEAAITAPDVTVIAPAGNAVTLTLQLGGATLASASAIGLLL